VGFLADIVGHGGIQHRRGRRRRRRKAQKAFCFGRMWEEWMTLSFTSIILQTHSSLVLHSNTSMLEHQQMAEAVLVDIAASIAESLGSLAL
jgi:hypothetical protein